MTKICSKCRIEKDVVTLFKKRSDRAHAYHSWCVECKQEYDRLKINYKLRNDDHFLKLHKERNRRSIQTKRSLVKDYLRSNPCLNCGESDVEVLDFDHKDRLSKEDAISNMVHNLKPTDKIFAEIAKCDVLCGNCHRHKTMHENGSWRSYYCTVLDCKYK
jgi:hypothetical protein